MLATHTRNVSCNAEAASADPLAAEFKRLGARSPWMASFAINGRLYGSGLNHEQDVRPPHFFRHVANPRRILELGSCQGGGTFQLAKYPGVEEVVAIEGRDYNIAKAKLAQRALGVSNVTFLHGDLETFNVASLGRFDAVYCVGVLYHVPKPWELLARLAWVTDVLYINTHYCPKNQVQLTLHGYEGKKWMEFGFDDPLSGLSAWSFWPTLVALARMLLDAGFIPEILETDTLGTGQSPHGTTILARRAATEPALKQADMLAKMWEALAQLPDSAGSPPRKPWWWRYISLLMRA
jgi:hypothetical protein